MGTNRINANPLDDETMPGVILAELRGKRASEIAARAEHYEMLATEMRRRKSAQGFDDDEA